MRISANFRWTHPPYLTCRCGCRVPHVLPVRAAPCGIFGQAQSRGVAQQTLRKERGCSIGLRPEHPGMIAVSPGTIGIEVGPSIVVTTS